MDSYCVEYGCISLYLGYGEYFLVCIRNDEYLNGMFEINQRRLVNQSIGRKKKWELNFTEVE